MDEPIGSGRADGIEAADDDAHHDASGLTILGVIAARGGSKGLPGKNTMPLAGLPLIAHSIRCAQRCPELTRCIVSTDSDRIAAVAKQYGAEVPFLRPPELAADTTPMMPVLRHALQWAEDDMGRQIDAVLLLQASNPGRLPQDVARAVSMLQDDPTADGVVACSRPTFNPYWVGVVERDGYMARAYEQDRGFDRRQEVPSMHRINGALYLWRRRHVMDGGAWYRTRQRMLEIPEARAIDIDELWDLQVAEAMVAAGLIRFPWV